VAGSDTPKKNAGKRAGTLDDETMVALKPIAPAAEEEKEQPAKSRTAKKTPFDDPTMKHVANAPRPKRTKYDDETMRALTPIEQAIAPSAPISRIAPSAAAETQGALPVAAQLPTSTRR
jgi:hypothetical protein